MSDTPYEFRPIGYVHSEHRVPEKTPIQPVFAKGCLGTAEILPEFAEGLRDLEEFSHLYLVYRFHRSNSVKLTVKPFLQDEEHGVFATRAPCRPNPIGLSIVELVRREGNILYLDGVDLLDGTPLLDIKPYTARFDRIDGTRNGWQDHVDEKDARQRGLRGYEKASDNGTDMPAFDTEYDACVRFHGHCCPGLTIGYRAARLGMRKLNAFRAVDEEFITIVENNSCSVDAVQWLTGCTFGKGNLFFHDVGKQVFTFALRTNGRAVRVSLKPREERIGEAPPQERDALTRWLLTASDDALFTWREETIPLPAPAQIRESVRCFVCGEDVMASRIVNKNGHPTCIPCSKT